jgi:hypothetical protein
VTTPGALAERFVGEICGIGTTSGVRIVIGRWNASPFGPFADAMVERADGRRVLIAPNDEIAGYVSAVYEFDEVVVSEVVTGRPCEHLRFEGGPLAVTAAVGGRPPLGWMLRAVPRPIATGRAWPLLVDPVARVLLPGVRTRGVTPGGFETYAATDLHRVAAMSGSWHGHDLGSLAPLEPPVRFGFSSAPRRPSIVAVTTTVRRR